MSYRYTSLRLVQFFFQDALQFYNFVYSHFNMRGISHVTTGLEKFKNFYESKIVVYLF